ncbi:hypothetical protein [Amycolatopsis sp. NBC_01480]|nr:hypothetical protein [Amycolatopsis sp. NBC_01480]
MAEGSAARTVMPRPERELAGAVVLAAEGDFARTVVLGAKGEPT